MKPLFFEGCEDTRFRAGLKTQGELVVIQGVNVFN